MGLKTRAFLHKHDKFTKFAYCDKAGWKGRFAKSMSMVRGGREGGGGGGEG